MSRDSQEELEASHKYHNIYLGLRSPGPERLLHECTSRSGKEPSAHAHQYDGHIFKHALHAVEKSLGLYVADPELLPKAPRIGETLLSKTRAVGWQTPKDSASTDGT